MNDVSTSTLPDNIDPNLIDKRTKNGKPLDLKKLLDLKFNKRLSNAEIARTLGYSQPYIGRVIKSFANLTENIDLVDVYENNRVQLLSGIELNILQNFGKDDRIKKASINNLAYALQNVSNLRRLEAGQSTQNIGISIQSKLSKALDKSRGTLRDTSGSEPYNDEIGSGDDAA